MLFSERLTEDSMKKLGNPNHLRRSVAFHLELVGVLVRLSLQEQLSPQWPRALAFKVGSGPCLIVLRHVQHTHTHVDCLTLTSHFHGLAFASAS